MYRLSICLCLLVVLGCAKQTTNFSAGSGPKPTLNTKYIPSSAVAAVVVYPKQLTTRPELELMPFEIMSAVGKQETGFDPLEIEQAIGLLAAPIGTFSPETGIILHFASPQKLSQKILDQTEAVTANGVTYQRGMPLCYCAVNDRTMLIATESFLKSMLAAKGEQKSELMTLLKGADLNSDVNALVVVEPLRPQIADGLKNIPPLPPQVQDLLKLPDLIKNVVLQLNVGTSSNSTIVLTARDRAAAAQAQQTINSSLAFGKELFLTQALQQQQFAGSDAVQQATAAYLKRVAAAIEKRLQPTQQNEQLVLTMRSDLATTGVLVSLLLPAVQAAREAAQRMQGANNLKQISIGLHQYHDIYKHFPARASFDADGKPLLSWRVHLLPVIGENALYQQFHLDEPWDSAHNQQLIERIPVAYQNPSLPKDGKTNFLVLVHDDAVFRDKEVTEFTDIADGTSNTILLVEANADQSVAWTQPTDVQYDPSMPLEGLGELRRGGFQAAFADASVRFVANSIDEDTLRAIVTRAKGEHVANLP